MTQHWPINHQDVFSVLLLTFNIFILDFLLTCHHTLHQDTLRSLWDHCVRACVYVCVLIFHAGQRMRGKTDPGEARQRERKLVCFGNKPQQLRNPYVCRALAGPNLAVIPCFLNMHDKLQSCYRGPARLNAQPGRPTLGGSDWRTGLIKVGPTKINTLRSVSPFEPL